MATLSFDEVMGRLCSITNPEVVKELYSFGSMMINENVTRTNPLEKKAMWIGGYYGALLAFLVSKLGTITAMHWSQQLLISLAAILAVHGIICVLLALKINEQVWFDEANWFENKEGVLTESDYLKIFINHLF